MGTPRSDLAQPIMEWLMDPNQDLFIYDRIFPRWKSSDKSMAISVCTRESLLEAPDDKVGPQGGLNEIGTKYEQKTFDCEGHGLAHPVTYVEKALYRSEFDAELIASKKAGWAVKIRKEIRAATMAFDTSTWAGAALTTDLSGAPWATSTSAIIGPVRTACEVVRANCGLQPNQLIVGKALFELMKQNDEVQDALKYTQTMTDDVVGKLLGAVLGIQEVVVGGAVYNSAKQGQTFVGADIWGSTYAKLQVACQPDADPMEPSCMRGVLWTGITSENLMVYEVPDSVNRRTLFCCEEWVDEWLIDAYFGHLLKVA